MSVNKSINDGLNHKYKKLNSLFSRIKEEFSSYENSGLLDEGLWYNDVKYILNILGASTYIYREDFLDVRNYNVFLPNDFHLLDYALKVNKTVSSIADTDDAPFLTQLNFDVLSQNKDVHIYDGCNPCCIPIPNTCVFNAYEKVFVKRDDLSNYKYDRPELLRLGNVDTRQYCTSSIENLTTNYNKNINTITIHNGKIYTNFREGDIYISYFAFPLDEETGLPLIIDNSKIEKAIEDYIKYNIVKKLVLNKESDLVNLISLYREEYKTSLADAKFHVKLPSFNDMIQSTRLENKLNDIRRNY
jgi:hypothetical protein